MRTTGEDEQLAVTTTDTAGPSLPKRPRRRTATPTDRLRHHGDGEAMPGLKDLAVNVRRGPAPQWLQQAILGGLRDITRYPNAAVARAALSAQHGIEPDAVLVTNGATEAFTLMAAMLPHEAMPHVAMVHPQFSEPERAFLASGHRVSHVLCHAAQGFAFDPQDVPEDADVVILGNPTNPTGRLHRAEDIRSLVRPDRVVIVDEAFMDIIPGEPEALVSAATPGLLVVRSLTKTWGMPGLRIGYVTGDKDLIAGLEYHQPPWSVNAVALAAAAACATDEADADRLEIALRAEQERSFLHTALSVVARDHQGVEVPPEGHVPFALVKVPYGQTRRLQMRSKGWAIRGCGTFPGLSDDWWRVAARDAQTTTRFLADLQSILKPAWHTAEHT